MHYSMTAFSKDRTIPTIIPMDPHVEIGQRNHLSHYDTQKLLITYKCNDITEPDKENKKYTFTPKRNKVHQHKLPAENVPCKIEEKTEAILTIQNRIANKLEDSNHIDFGTLSGDDQKAYIKHKYRVRSNYYPLPLIYSPIYPHIHFHIHNN
ncbi:uncharacterized protein LOC113563432 [Ooceraea biroi]|uniref:uncharacterized protein LOC113563432 n=1 Tax=Ooceraea biroi TaxID=2015173 RepID=UPI000F0821A0|nr:uncharacterized protein LOC113563432 [Ooceraea biroi]